MKKGLFIPAVILTIAAIVYIIIGVTHPELSLPVSHNTACVIYGLYADLLVVLYIFSFVKKERFSGIFFVSLILELVAILLLTMSIFSVKEAGQTGYYLPGALSLNAIAMILNIIGQKKKVEEIKEDIAEKQQDN